MNRAARIKQLWKKRDGNPLNLTPAEHQELVDLEHIELQALWKVFNIAERIDGVASGEEWFIEELAGAIDCYNGHPEADDPPQTSGNIEAVWEVRSRMGIRLTPDAYATKKDADGVADRRNEFEAAHNADPKSGLSFGDNAWRPVPLRVLSGEWVTR